MAGSAQHGYSRIIVNKNKTEDDLTSPCAACTILKKLGEGIPS